MTRKPQILIIGSCGYIGSSLYEFLKVGYSVKGFDSGLRGIVAGQNCIVGDHNAITQDLIDQFRIIIFLSGASSVPSCNPQTAAETISAAQRIFEFARPDQLVIYASSGSLCNGELNSTEEYTHKPYINDYDASKASIESLHLAHPTKSIIGLRFGTVFGFSQNFRSDLIFNKLYLDCLEKQEITINFPRTYRSFLQIDDLTRSIETIIYNFCSGKKSAGVYNLASFSQTFGELAESFNNYFNNRIKINITEIGKNNYNFSLNCDKFMLEYKSRMQYTNSFLGIEKLDKDFKDKRQLIQFIGDRR